MIEQMELFGGSVISPDLGYNFSKDECLEALKQLSVENPDKDISRDFFRARTQVPDKIWSYYFGKFTTFKQAAGLVPSRLEKKFLNKQDRESSVDTLRQFNKEKFGWSDLYPKTNSKRFVSILCVSDTHDIYCDPFYRRMSLVAANEIEPDVVVFNGDIFDHPEISRHRKRPDEYQPIQRNKWVRQYFKDMRDASPDAEMNFVEGNHEYRIITYMMDNSPYVMDVLNLHGINAREFLGLDEFEINYYSRSDFGTITEADIQNQLKKNFYKFEDKVLFHHYPQGRQFGMPGCSAHQHVFQTWPMFNEEYGAYNWYQLGCGARRYMDYHLMMGQKWQNGFMIIVVDRENKKNTIFNYVDCSNEICLLNGKLYKRNEEEAIFVP